MASSDIYTTATQLAILQAGRTPVWVVQSSDPTLPPDLASDGVALQNSTRVLVHVSTRERAAGRTARVTFPVVSLTATYTITITQGSTQVAYVYDANAGGAADLGDIIDGLLATMGALNLAHTNVGDLTLLLQGAPSVDEDFGISVTYTAGSMAVVTEYTSYRARMWWLMANRPGSAVAPVPWVGSDDQIIIGRQGRVERYDSAGLLRLAVQLENPGKHPDDGASDVTYTLPVISIGAALAELS